MTPCCLVSYQRSATQLHYDHSRLFSLGSDRPLTPPAPQPSTMSDLNIAIAAMDAHMQPEQVLRRTIAAIPIHARIAGVEELLRETRQDPESPERLIADLEDVLRETRLQLEPAEADVQLPPQPGVAEVSVQTSPLPTATEAAAQSLPPQLAAALGDNAARVADMCFLAPGVPWSNQLLDDMLADVRQCGTIDFTNGRNGVIIRVVIRGQVQHATRRRPRTENLEASIYARRRTDPVIQMSSYKDSSDQPFTRAGLRKTIEWCQENANNVFRRGFCDPCLDGQRPAKRLRVSGSQVCSSCLLGQSI